MWTALSESKQSREKKRKINAWSPEGAQQTRMARPKRTHEPSLGATPDGGWRWTQNALDSRVGSVPLSGEGDSDNDISRRKNKERPGRRKWADAGREDGVMFSRVWHLRYFGACADSTVHGLVTKPFPGLFQHQVVTIMDCKFIDIWHLHQPSSDQELSAAKLNNYGRFQQSRGCQKGH